MNTKIYNGYRLPYSSNLFSVVDDLSRRLEPIQRRLTLQAVTVVALLLTAPRKEGEATDPLAETVKLVSNSQLNPKDVLSVGTIWTQAGDITEKVQERLARPFAVRVPEFVDLHASMSLSVDSLATDYVYALFYADRPEYIKVWEETAGVEQWPYWNNTDRPDGVDEAHWRDRAQTWDRVLDQIGGGRGSLS